MKASLALYAAMAAGFAASPAASQAPAATASPDSITYTEVTGLWGYAASCGAPRCPAYSLVVNADGSARFEGRDTAVATKSFRVSDATWRALVDRLARYRPARSIIVEPGNPACAHSPGMEVGRDPVTAIAWAAGGGVDRILFNGECDRSGAEDAVTAVEAARQIFFELLPLRELIGRDRTAR